VPNASNMDEPEQPKEQSDDPLLGSQVGNYRVIKEIGSGGMGEVYLGEHPEIGTKVAIKVLAPHLSASPEMASRFMSEARAANQANHPGIIQIFDFGRLEDSRLYMVMEFLDGEELTEHLEKNAPLSIAETRDLLEQIAGALDAAHEVGIVHRDLKPANIFLHWTGKKRLPKILDFGIAKLLQPDLSSSQKTATGMVMGTPLYMAPEQAAGKVDEISPRSDIYSLGVILYQMLSADLPIQGPSAAVILAAHIMNPPVPLKEVAPNLPPALYQVIMRCLEKKPDDRFQSAGALLEAFDAAIVGTSLATRANVPTTTAGAQTSTIAYQSSPGSFLGAGLEPDQSVAPAAVQDSQPPGWPTSQVADQQAEQAAGMPANVMATGPWNSGQQQPEAVSPPKRGMVIGMGVAIGILTLAAVALLVIHPWKKTKSKTGAATHQTNTTDHRAPTNQIQPPRPAVSPLRHTVSFTSKQPGVTVAVRVGSGPVRSHEIPFSIQAPNGAQIHVRATKTGYPPQTQDFVATASTEVELVFAGHEHEKDRNTRARSHDRHRTSRHGATRHTRPRTKPRPVQPRPRPARPRHRPRPRHRKVGASTLGLD